MAFQIYKGNQAKNTRLATAIGVSLVVCIGCYQLYKWLNSLSLNVQDVTKLWIATLVPVVIFVLLCALAFWIVNRPSVADFMIVSEGELKKVNWSSRKEIYDSTIIVISVVILMGMLLGFSDLILGVFFGEYVFKA